jgi:hypothetical protein
MSMNKSTVKRRTANTIPHRKVDVFLQVPEVLHSWLRDEVKTAGMKNVQEKIVELIRSAREAQQAQAA